jgi:hypothetical protein
MQTAKQETKTLFRTDVFRGIEKGIKGVDRTFKHNRGIGAIFGYAVLAKGKLNDGDVRDWEMDDISLDQVVDLGNKAKLGIKSRFGHPNMSAESLGTFLGRAKIFRKDGDIVRADLFFDETAYKTPNGDLATYILDLAENDSNAFGTSMVFDADLAYRLEEDGTPKKDKDGKNLPALVRFTKLFASDVVDDPAATPGLFGKFFNSSVELSAKATDFLDKLLNNPDALDRIVAFLDRYRINRVEIDEGDTQAKDKLNQKEGVKMEEFLKGLTLEALSNSRPDLVDSIKSEASKEAVAGERLRVLSIIKAAHVEFKGLGMETPAEDAIEKGLTVDAALAGMRKSRLDAIEANGNKAPGASEDDPTKTPTHLDRAKKYQADHPGVSITDALKATVEKKAN